MYYNFGISGYDARAQFRTAVTGAHKLYEFGNSLNRLDDRNAGSVFEAFYHFFDLINFRNTIWWQRNLY